VPAKRYECPSLCILDCDLAGIFQLRGQSNYLRLLQRDFPSCLFEIAGFYRRRHLPEESQCRTDAIFKEDLAGRGGKVVYWWLILVKRKCSIIFSLIN